MPYHKFKENDLFHNRIETNPEVNFVVYSGSVYYNNRNFESGAFANPVRHVPKGHISLYELNIDRLSNQLIYPFITKEGSITSFRTVSTTAFNSDFDYGDTLTGSYPLSASISRDYLTANTGDKSLKSLRNTIDFYKPLSPHFQYSSSLRALEEIPVNLISIPSIFYGSSIKKGSIDLKFYVSGTLIARVQDEKQNGELIQVGPIGSTESGSIVGFALYTEGFFVLTSSRALDTPHTELYSPVTPAASPSWIHFATTGSGAQVAASSSFDITFKGVNYVPTLTMFAHASEGMLNYSNNPTFLTFDSYAPSASVEYSSSAYHGFARSIKNTVKSPYNDPTGSFRKQTYISKIGIYDEDKNLIAIAKVATPIRKRETDSYTFKLKLDF